MTSEKLDMSLDEISKQEKQQRQQQSRRRRNNPTTTTTTTTSSSSSNSSRSNNTTNNSGPLRRQPRNRRSRTNPTSQDIDKWDHDGYFEEENSSSSKTQQRRRYPAAWSTTSIPGEGRNAIPFGTRVSIENLKYDVFENDLKDLMDKIGLSVEHVKLYYDKSGRSEGKAEVIFRTRGDAERALRAYDGAAIDGQVMRIWIHERNRGGGGPGGGAGRERRSDNEWRSNLRSDFTESGWRDRIRTERRQNNRSEREPESTTMVVDEENIPSLKVRVSF